MTDCLEFTFKHNMDIDVSWCEWRRGYVAVDMNTYAGDDSPFPAGEGRTRAEAIEDLIIHWMEHHDK